MCERCEGCEGKEGCGKVARGSAPLAAAPLFVRGIPLGTPDVAARSPGLFCCVAACPPRPRPSLFVGRAGHAES